MTSIWQVGNQKLGKGVYHTSRAVGVTCPSYCQYLNNGCYAERLEKRFPAVKASWRRNTKEMQGLREGLQKAADKGKYVRFHVGGDFQWEGYTDFEYAESVSIALGETGANALAYTHIIKDDWLVETLKDKLKLFASVHSEDEIKIAESHKHTRFALCMEETKAEWQGGAWLERYGKRFLVCPEQRGKLPSCETCGYCWKDKGHVAFLRH